MPGHRYHAFSLHNAIDFFAPEIALATFCTSFVCIPTDSPRAFGSESCTA